jgi:hypothetical protein
MGNMFPTMANGLKFSGPVSLVIKRFCREAFKSTADHTHAVFSVGLNCIGDICYDSNCYHPLTCKDSGCNTLRFKLRVSGWKLLRLSIHDQSPVFLSRKGVLFVVPWCTLTILAKAPKSKGQGQEDHCSPKLPRKLFVCMAAIVLFFLVQSSESFCCYEYM